MASLTAEAPVALPDFLWCLFAGVLLRNLVAPAFGLRLSDPAIDVVGGIALALFLAMTMATIRLWELAALAGPLLTIVGAQAVRTRVSRPCPHVAGVTAGLFNALCCIRRAPLKRLGSRCEMIFSLPYGAGFGLSRINGLEHASRER
ncbi:sodium/glutamate symporter [Dankookia sp. GCM10030260]|uniref:sodium/glutamate symporter n=1 Tax=Dankookia sp. GCM10030260 TaxID=3273390 RepID=UPI00361E93AF